MQRLQHRLQTPFTGSRPSRTAVCKAQAQRECNHVDRQEMGLAHPSKAVACAAAALCFAAVNFAPLPAQADTYSDRAAAMQKRKELLQQTREKALAKGGVESPSEPAPPAAAEAAPAESVAAPDQEQQAGETIASSPANSETLPEQVTPAEKAAREKQAASMRESLRASRASYEDESSKETSKLKPGKEADKNPSWFKSLLDGGKDNPAPAPQESGPAAKFVPEDVQASQNAPAVPAPPSKEVKTPKKEPQQQDLVPGSMASSSVDPLAPEGAAAKKEERYTSKPSTPGSLKSAQKPAAVKEASKKRRGPLPMWLAQILLLASFGGIGYGVFFKEQEVNAVLSVGVKSAASAYNTVQKKISKK